MSSDFEIAQTQLGRSEYGGIAEILRREIVAGTYPVGGRFPTEDALVQRFGVSRPTINNAVRALRDQGLVHVRRGVGAFVTDPTIRVAPADLAQFLADELAAGGKLLLHRPDRTVKRIILADGAAGPINADDIVDHYDALEGA